jgi:alkylation response protein AidB-like acyl-CoA dehydrogenase
MLKPAAKSKEFAASNASRAPVECDAAKPRRAGSFGAAASRNGRRMIDFTPSEEQALVADTVRQFAQKELRPIARKCEEARALPEDVLARAHELGLVASALPGALGGGGERSAVTAVLVAEELAWGDLALALAVLSPALGALPIADFGSDAQQHAWLPSYLGDRFVPGALAVAEPRIGSDAFRPETRARRDDADYLLDGAKCLVPWLPGGDDVIVTASEAGVTQAFVVPRGAPGLTATRDATMGVCALPLADVEFSGVRVPASAKLAAFDVRRLVARGRVALAACGVGVARAAFEVARDYAKEREAFGTKIAQKQAIAFLLANMAIEIDGARLLVWEAAWKLDQGDAALREATLAINQVKRIALDAADGAVQVLGGHGYIREYLPELHLRNARGLSALECAALV